MVRWNPKNGIKAENIKVDAFLNDIIEISKKYGLSISHEDWQGAFIVEEYSEDNTTWLLDAMSEI